LFAPDAETAETFENVMLGRPAAVTVPDVPDESAHVDDAAETASDVVPPPTTLIPVTLAAGRASVTPFTVTVTFEPEEPIAIAFAFPVGDTVHVPRNVMDVEPVALVLASIGADAETITTPESAIVTVTAHVPSTPVTHDVLLRLALVGVAAKETVAPDVGVPFVVTVATTLAGDPASTRAGAEAVTFTLGAGVAVGAALGVGVGLALGVGVGLALGVGVGLSLGVGLALGEESVGDGDALGAGDGVGEELGEGDGERDGDGDGAGVADGGVESLGLGEAVGSPSDASIDVAVQRLAIFDPIPESGCCAATSFDVSADPAGAYVGAGVLEGAGAGVGEGRGLVVGDACGLVDGRAVADGRTEVDGAAVDDGIALGAGFADGTTEGLTTGVVLEAVGAVTGRGAGVRQSSGCTMVSPVAASYRMILTPDSVAQAARLASSVGRNVTL